LDLIKELIFTFVIITFQKTRYYSNNYANNNITIFPFLQIARVK